MHFRDTEQRFSGLACNYAAARPSYAEALIEDLYTVHGFSPASVIADVGSGTGKFAEQLLRRGSTVWCVEPNGGHADYRRKDRCLHFRTEAL